MTGDDETSRMIRLVFARNFVRGRPEAINEYGTLGCSVDMNGLVRSLSLVSERDDGIEWSSGTESWLCYVWADVINKVHSRLSRLFEELDSRCLVLAFDSNTPLAKKPVQQKRREDSAKRKLVNNREPYRWPQADESRLGAWFSDDSTVEATWSEVFYNPVARLRLQEYIVRSLIDKFEMPVDASVIVEGAVLGGKIRRAPIKITALDGRTKEVRELTDEPARHTYSEADIRVVHWAEWLACNPPPGADPCAAVVVEERDADVLHALLLLEHARVSEGGPHASRPIYMKRTCSVYSGTTGDGKPSYTKVPEYVHIGGLYADITLLFGGLLTACRAQSFHTEPVELFMSLVLMRGDDYCPPLAYCTAKHLWSTLFDQSGTVYPWVESDLRAPGTPNRQPSRIALHYDAARNFVDLCYETIQRKKREAAAAAAEERRQAKIARGEKITASRARPASSKPPAGWPDDDQLRCLLARQCWQLDMLANARRPGCYAENELRAAPPSDYRLATAAASSTDDVPLSVYGFSRRGSEIFYAARVCPRDVYVVERPVQPVQLAD